jgi:hypothetical protein
MNVTKAECICFTQGSIMSMCMILMPNHLHFSTQAEGYKLCWKLLMMSIVRLIPYRFVTVV